MNIAIVGSRDLTKYDWFIEKVEETIKKWGIDYTDVNSVVSGGARGTDTLAEKFAKEKGIPLKVFKPDWRPNGVYDRGAGIKRNTDIINSSDRVIAFPSKKGRGTQDSIRKAQRSNKPCQIYYID